jgi:1-pyrroline-5-carboxylate dehydrogenase
MNNATPRLPRSENEPILSYAPGSPERASLKTEFARLLGGEADIPLIIGGRELRTGHRAAIRRPDAHATILGHYELAGEAEARAAIEAALAARPGWAALAWEERAAVFLRAAELVAGPRRSLIVAATMLGQSKTVHQAEIDAACEVADFLRLNPVFMEGIYASQPASVTGEWNRMAYRPLEGFVYAVSPFNFTAIAANLVTAPAMMGNVVLWKPASTAVLSNWVFMRILEEAGLPPGVINFLPGGGTAISRAVLAHPEFAGLHFTGSTAVFNGLWRQVADNLPTYKSYPRVVGETGGKDFIFVDPSADLEAAVVACVRGAFEYQGQKCSAASRLYLPASRAEEALALLTRAMGDIAMGEVGDFRNFMGAVIDEASFDALAAAIAKAGKEAGCRVLAGGGADKTKGFFVEPTLILCEHPRSEVMTRELFGPVLAAHVYDDGDMEGAYRLVDSTSPYALTGAIFARDRLAIARALSALGAAAGNLYVNDKPTGAVVGRQPFGGARGSGTNDKAGSMLNLLRWCQAGAIKENFAPARDWRYPSMEKA